MRHMSLIYRGYIRNMFDICLTNVRCFFMFFEVALSPRAFLDPGTPVKVIGSAARFKWTKLQLHTSDE